MALIESDVLVSNTNTMRKNLLEQLPGIIINARQEAERILETRHSLALDTREWVLPAKDSALLNWIKADKLRRRMNAQEDVQPNRLIHGNDLLVMAALLAGDAVTPSLQGKLDLIYMDMPFGCMENFEIGASLPDGAAMPPVTGRCAHPDELESGMVTYLTMLTLRLILARELLSDCGSICMQVGTSMKYYVRMIIDDLFGNQHRGNRKMADIDNDAGCTCGSRPYTIIISLQRDRNVNAVQGPQPLLEAIILALTRPGSMVADFSGRSGNTACTAERLGRRWITSDSGRSACAYMRSRLIDQNAEPFLYQAISKASEVPEKTVKVLADDACRAGDVSQIVLLFFGALPLPAEQDCNRNLGQIFTAGSKTLVWVESPDELTGLATLKKAIAQRDSSVGGWDRVAVLAWKLEPAIDASIATLNDSRLEVLKIPVDLFDMLEKIYDAERTQGAVPSADTQA